MTERANASASASDRFEAQRAALLEAMLTHVVFDGWSQRAFTAAAKDLGLSPAEAVNLFPNGIGEVVEAFSAECDRKMLAELETLDLESMKVRERIAAAVRSRLMVMTRHREAVRRGLNYFALPPHGGRGLRCLYRTIDTIWYAAGDRSTDYNFYTKRLLLAGVYSSTLLYWLNDQSEGFESTWRFLDRRIDEVLKVGGTLGKGIGRLLDLPDRLFAGRTRRARGMRRPGEPR